MYVIERLKPLWALLILFLFISNFMLYQTSTGATILPEETQYVVLGSMLDFILVLPLLIMLYRKKFSLKSSILFASLGCILIRFVIPPSMLEPYETITWVGIFVEGLIVAFEILLLITFVRYFPRIISSIKESKLPVLFSFSNAVNNHVKHNPIIQMLCSELLMFYYAFASWKKATPIGMTMYKKSSFIAFQVMMIHAIVVETLGVHYWLHTKAPIVSIVLLVVNIYSIVFFLADLQALRLNPIYFTNDAFYISLGLMKRAKIDYRNIEAIIEDPELLQKKLSKNTIDFVIRDFEKVYPDLILKMKSPQNVTLFMGIEKQYEFVAIKCDSPLELKEQIKIHIS
jgi:hypothetical protein